jgi:glycine hydroxymethyltransferase
MALLKPGDANLCMSLAARGHLTHGAPPHQSGKWFKTVRYGVRREDAQLAREHRPKMIIVVASAYSRAIDFARFRSIANSVGAFLMVDMAHYAGLWIWRIGRNRSAVVPAARSVPQ